MNQVIIDTTLPIPRVHAVKPGTPEDVTPSALNTARRLLRLKEGQHFGVITRGKGGRLDFLPLAPAEKIELGE